MRNLFNAALLLRDDMTTVSVSYETSRRAKTYDFVILRSMVDGLKPGDVLIVDANSGGQNTQTVGDPSGYSRVYVRRVHSEPKIDLNFSGEYRFILARLHNAEVQRAIASTRAMSDRIRERQAVQTRDSLLGALGLTSDDLKQLQHDAKEDSGEIDIWD